MDTVTIESSTSSSNYTRMTRKREGDKETNEVLIKSSLSDFEVSESNDDEDTQEDDLWNPEDTKLEIESCSSDHLSDNGSFSASWNDSSVEESTTKKLPVIKIKRKKADVKKDKETLETTKVVKRKRAKSPKPKRPRGRRKQPRRYNFPEGAGEDYTSEEDEGDPVKAELQVGIGYPIEFKMKVLKYAGNHSTRATSEKFKLNAKRVREWIQTREKLEEESQKGVRRPQIKTDRFTVAERLQAVEFASERSLSEARLLYNVDRRTIGKWKSQKKELEASVMRGEGCRMTQAGAGRPRRFAPIEENLRDWIVTLRLKGVTINYKMVLNKAKSLIEENPSLKGVPSPRTWSWVQVFLKKYNLLGLLGNVLGQEDQRDLLKIRERDANQLSEKHVEIPENPNTRNRRTISLEDKVSIIRRIEHGETQGTVAKSLKVATSTIQTIWSGRNDILRKFVNPKSTTKSDALVWKTYSAVGTSLRDWLDERSNKLEKVDYDILMKKAIQLSEIYKLTEFNTESKQWLKVFCKKNNLKDILAEFRRKCNNTGDNNIPLNVHSSSQFVPTATDSVKTHMAEHSVKPSNHHNDEYHPSDFDLSKYSIPEAVQNDVLKPSLPAAPQSVLKPCPLPPGFQDYSNCASTPEENHKVSSSEHSTTTVTTSLAVESVHTLRSWIYLNYGPNEETLNNLLSGLENAVLRKQVAELTNVLNKQQ